MADQYANWRVRLANAALPKDKQQKIPTFETTVDPGFYRKRITEKTAGGATRTIGYEPVAFWTEGEGDARELVGVIGGRSLNAGQCEQEWLWVCDKPIPEEVYRAVAERGEPWPDQHPIIMPKLTPEQEAEVRKEMAKPGVLIPGPALDVVIEPAPDLSQEIVAEIEKLIPGVEDYRFIESDEQGARAQDLRSQLTALAGRLDKYRETLVRPHLDAQQKINARFNPVIRSTKELAESIRKSMTIWETQKREAAREAARRAEEERQRIIAENEAAARKAAEEGKPQPEAAPAVVQAQSNAPPPSEQIKGMTGRAASVREAFEAVITDQDAAYAMLKGHPVIIEAIRKVAQARVDAGIDTPGVTKKEIVKIR